MVHGGTVLSSSLTVALSQGQRLLLTALLAMQQHSHLHFLVTAWEGQARASKEGDIVARYAARSSGPIADMLNESSDMAAKHIQKMKVQFETDMENKVEELAFFEKATAKHAVARETAQNKAKVRHVQKSHARTRVACVFRRMHSSFCSHRFNQLAEHHDRVIQSLHQAYEAIFL